MKPLITITLIVALTATAHADCGQFFCTPKVRAVVAHHAIAVKQVAVPVYQPGYQVGYGYQSAAEREVIAQRAAEILELRQLRSEVQALRAGVTSGASYNTAPRQEAASNSALHQHCAKCHGTDKNSPAGGLYIDAGSQLSDEVFRKSLEFIAGEADPPAQMREAISAIKDSEKPALMQELLRAK